MYSCVCIYVRNDREVSRGARIQSLENQLARKVYRFDLLRDLIMKYVGVWDINRFVRNIFFDFIKLAVLKIEFTVASLFR